MTAPAVTVTICCYNSEKYLAETYESVLAQTFSDWEALFLDDGSTDGTAELIRSFRDPRVRYERQANQGMGAARNRLAALARGRYIACLDHDDLWLPERLARAVPLLDSRPDIGLTYSDAAIIDGSGAVVEERYRNFRAREGYVFDELLTTPNFVNWQTVTLRTEAARKTGFGFLRTIGDYEFLLRFARDNHFLGIGEVLARYRWFPTNTSNKNLRVRNMEGVALYEKWLRADLPPETRRRLKHKLAEEHRSFAAYLAAQPPLKDRLLGRVHQLRGWLLSRA